MFQFIDRNSSAFCGAVTLFCALLPNGGLCQDAKSSDASDVQTLSVPPKSLLEQRLHPASFPGEAEIRCGIGEPCVMGLARHFSVGADVFNMLGTPIVAPMREPGKWIFYDGFLGFQFLRQQGDPYYANGFVGYRGFSYEDSNSHEVSTEGITFRIAFAQEVWTNYTQGVTFGGYMGNVKYSDEDLLYRRQGGDLEEVRSAVKKFYPLSRRYPRVQVAFPADFEVINWKASHIDLPNHLRGYARVEPFYIQNDLAFSHGYSWTEKNFGARLGISLAYESKPVDQADRYSFLVSAGPEFATSTFTFERGEKSADYKFDLPRRPGLDYYAQIQGSYQF